MNSLKNIRHHFIFKGEEAPKNSIPENIRNQFREEMKNLVDEVHQADPEFLTVGALEHLESLGKKFDDINQKEKYKTFIYEYLESQLTGVSKETFRSESESALAGLEEILAPISGSESGGEAEKPKGDLGKVESEMGSAMEKVKGFKVEKTPEEFPAQYNNPNEVKQGLVLYNTRSQVIREGAQELSFSLASMQQAVGEYEAHKESKSFGSKLAFWKEDPQGEALEKNLKIFQYEYNLARKKLDSARAELAVQAPLLNEAPEKAKAAILADQSVEDEKEGTKSRIELLKENKELILKQKENLETQRKGLEEKAKDVEKSEGVAGSTLAGLLGAKESIEQALISTPNHPALLAKLTVIEGQINRLGAAKTAIKESEDGLNALLETKDGAATALELFATGMDATIASLEYSSQVLEQQIQLKEMTLEGIDDMDRMVAESILINNINNDLLFQSIDTQWNGLPKEIGTGIGSRLFDAGDMLWSNSIGAVYSLTQLDHVGAGVKWLGGKMVEGLEWWSDNMIEGTRSWLEERHPLLGDIYKYTLGTTSNLGIGILKGASKLIEGVGSIFQNPRAFGKGLAAMAGFNEEWEFSFKTMGKTWKAMGQGLVAWEDLKSGDYEKFFQGLGEGVFNVGTMFLTGGGATAARAGVLAAGKATTWATKAGWSQLAIKGLARPAGFVYGTGRQVVKNLKTTVVDTARGTGRLGRALITPSKFKRLSLKQVSLGEDIARAWKVLGSVDELSVTKLVARSLRSKKRISMKELSKVGIKTPDQIIAFNKLVAKQRQLRKARRKLRNPKFENAKELAKELAKMNEKLSRSERIALKARLKSGTSLGLRTLTAPIRASFKRLTPKRVNKRFIKVEDNISNLLKENSLLNPYKGMEYAKLKEVSKLDLLKAGLKPTDIMSFNKLKRLTRNKEGLVRLKNQRKYPGTVAYRSHAGDSFSFKPTERIAFSKKEFKFGERVFYNTKGGKGNLMDGEGFIVGVTEKGQAIITSKRPKPSLFENPSKLNKFIDENAAVLRNKNTGLKTVSGKPRSVGPSPSVVARGTTKFERKLGTRNVAGDLSSAAKLSRGQEMLVHCGDISFIVRRAKTLNPWGKKYKIYSFDSITGKRSFISKTKDYPFEVSKTFQGKAITEAFSTKGVFSHKNPPLFDKARGVKYSEVDLKVLKNKEVSEIILTNGDDVVRLQKTSEFADWNLVDEAGALIESSGKPIKLKDAQISKIKLGEGLPQFKEFNIQGIKLDSPFDGMNFTKVLDKLPLRTSLPTIVIQFRARVRAILEVKDRAKLSTERAKLRNAIDDLVSRPYVSRAEHVQALKGAYDDLVKALGDKNLGTQVKEAFGFSCVKLMQSMQKLRHIPEIGKIVYSNDFARRCALLGVSNKFPEIATFGVQNISPAALRLALNEESLDEDLPSFYEDIVYAEPTTKRTIDDGSDIKLVKHTEYKTTS